MSDKTFALDWAEFLAQMQTTRALLERGRAGDAPRTPHGFVATLGAVKAAHDLLVARGHPDLATVFYLLLQAMSDIPKGVQPTLLTPTYRVKGDEAWLVNRRSVAARAVDEFMLSGMGLDDACRKVWPIARQEVPDLKYETFKNWRKLAKSADPDSPGSRRYHAPYPPGLRTDPANRATYFILQLETAPALRNPAIVKRGPLEK